MSDICDKCSMSDICRITDGLRKYVQKNSKICPFMCVQLQRTSCKGYALAIELQNETEFGHSGVFYFGCPPDPIRGPSVAIRNPTYVDMRWLFFADEGWGLPPRLYS